MESWANAEWFLSKPEVPETITVTEGGRQLVISKQRAMLKSLMAKAMKGETAAARALINLIYGGRRLSKLAI